MQVVRHRVPSNRRLLAIVAVVIYGCTTDNTENWAITTPAANADAIIYASTPVNVPVAGTSSVNQSGNNVAIIDPANNGLLSEILTVTSDDSGKWNGNVKLIGAPAEILPGGNKPAKVCTGTPKPSISGTGITKHTTRDITIHLQRYAMP